MIHARKKDNNMPRPSLQAIKHEQARADALFLSIGDGAIATDENGKISHVNQVALDVLEFQKNDVLGKWFPEIIVSLDEDMNKVPRLERHITQAFMTGKAVSGRTYYRTKSNKVIPVFVTVSPIILKGRPVGAIEVFRDISLEYEIDKMKSEFI